ncbi:apm2 [Symbiodinium sp. CCMP2456]|nr:apm2 [Symbiodinium sp. CCMP2456]
MGFELRALVLLRVSPAVDPFLDVEHVATGNLALCAEFGPDRDTRLKRREQEREQREHRLDELFDELDISGDGMLDASEVKMLLTGMAEGKEPSEEELSFIMKTTTKKPDGDRMPRY